jgi:hypothetical protein
VLGIRRTGNKTYFYTSDITQIRRILLELGLMTNNWVDTKQGVNGNYVSFSENISDEHRDAIRGKFIDRSKPKNINIIKGFKGCLITGFNLEWV